MKQSIDKKLNPLSNQELEFDSIEYLKTIIEDTFDVKFNGEGCLADCCIKPKHITEDSWLMVQIKSTAKPSSLRYKFDCHSKYINCIIMCFTLEKHNGRKKRISYQQGDNDFYWLNVNNKQHFYVIPEHELISRNYINIDKRSSISLNPNSKKGNNIWANEYLFDYTNITKMDEEKLKKMFHINIFV